jgi:hypothetical protein
MVASDNLISIDLGKLFLSLLVLPSMRILLIDEAILSAVIMQHLLALCVFSCENTILWSVNTDNVIV